MFRRAACFVVFFSVSSLAAAWWNPEWAFRKPIEIDTSRIAAPVTEVPVLVRLHTGNFGYFLDVMEGAADLRFGTADDAPLKYHIEKFDAVNQMALIWVKAPSLSAGDANTRLWMYYSNASAVKGDDIAGTYDANQVLIYHFDETSGLPQDKTAYGNHPGASTAKLNPASLIGQGARLDGAESIVIPNSPSLGLSVENGFSFSAWVKLDAAQTLAKIMEFSDGASGLSLNVQGTALYASYRGADTAAVETAKSAELTAGTWHHVGIAVGKGQMTAVLDGNPVGSVNAPITAMAGNLTIGAGGDGHGFVGEMDEVQVSNIARDAAWFKFAVQTQGMNADMLVYGEDESQESADTGGEEHASHFQVLWHKLDSAGRSVIYLCAMMAAISFVVMFMKSMLLAKVRKTNAKFLKAFESLGPAIQKTGNPRALMALAKQTKEFGDSPLFQVYLTGMKEVHVRVGNTAGAQAAGLRSHALSAIRGSMDARMVRESQRLNAQMVLLTIAISGGPFLGLLGTVVGVMITFAEIAATGDVNIAAIAPGMAAALMATIAGLGVAIPSLFGYNYLSSRVKEINADMHVFVDELSGKIAENFGD